MSTDDGVSSTLHVVELSHENGREATLDVLFLGGVKGKLPLVALLLRNIKEEDESRNLFFHAISTSTAHDSNLILRRNSAGAFEVEAVNLVLSL